MEQLKVYSAYDEKEIRSYPVQSEAECLGMLEECYRLFQNRQAWIPIPKRIEVLNKLLHLVHKNFDSLVLDAAREGGKPLIDSRVEVQRGADGIQIAIEELKRHSGEVIPMGISASSTQRLAFTQREPRGVVLAISAFNHPFNLIVHQVIPAVAAGCPVLVKPATTTPISCENLVNLLHEAGYPKEWCRMVICSNQTAEKLVTDPRIGFLTFIGSAKVGWSLRSKLPPGATCALEHGGVAPAIIDPSADLEKAIPALVKGGFYHAGQVCVSVQRIYVHESQISDFCKTFVEAVQKLEVGDPTLEKTEVGPLILPREVDRVDEWVQEAAQKGEVLCGGKKISKTVYEPTVILNPPDDVQLSQKEIFGPVVAVYSYKSFDEAIARANALNVSFQAAVFSQEIDRALQAAQNLNGMAVMINDHTAFRVDWMPFGGHRESGMGVGGIGYSIEDMTIKKMVVLRSPAI